MSIKQIIVSILLLTVVIGAYFAYISRERKLPISPQNLIDKPIATSTPLSYGTFTFLERNFKFHLDEEWTAPTGTIAYPKDIGDISFAFRKSGTTCILAYANRPGRESVSKYRQSSFSDRIVTADKATLDTSWYVHEDDLPNGFDFADNQTLPGEVRLTRYPEWTPSDFGEQGYFMLFDEKGGKVDPVCSTAASAMLSTLEMTYPDILLDVKSQGYLYIGTASNATPSIRFVSDDSPTIYKIIDISADLDTPPFVYGDRIYFVKAGELFETDVFTRNIEKIPMPVSQDDVINDFIIQGKTVYYLSGKDCRGYKETCSSDLVSYDLASRSSRTLAREAVSRTILGLDATEKKLYMRYVEGDAGCFIKIDEVYDLSKASLTKTERGGVCEGDPGADEAFAQIEIQEKRFGLDRDDSVIRIEGGKLFKEGEPAWAIGMRSRVRFSGYEPI